MEVKQRGNALGYKIVLSLYKVFGYNVTAFTLNFIALYYLFFTPSTKKMMRSYYERVGLPISSITYFHHIKQFAISIFDRFVSRITPQDLHFDIANLEVVQQANQGGIVLLSHIGSWSTAAHCLEDGILPMNLVMRENTSESIYRVEQSSRRYNEKSVKIIDLAQGAMAVNIQIANALSNSEFVAMMADRVVDARHKIEVKLLGEKVFINKTPFEIAKRLEKPLIALFVMQKNMRRYDLVFHNIDGDTPQAMAQNYCSVLDKVVKKYPLQWYNFYDFFKKG